MRRPHFIAVTLLVVIGSFSCVHHNSVRFDPVTEYVFENEFFLYSGNTDSSVGHRGTACPGKPMPYVSFKVPGIASSGDAELDAYRDWWRALGQSWGTLLMVPPHGNFSKKAQKPYCKGNRKIWKKNPGAHHELSLIATEELSNSGFLDILVSQAKEFGPPPAEVPLVVKNYARRERPALQVSIRPPHGNAQIFKYCLIGGEPAIVSNLTTAEQTSCFEKHLALLDGVEYTKDFNAWVIRINEKVGKVPLKKGERFQETMYADLEATLFFQRLSAACSTH